MTYHNAVKYLQQASIESKDSTLLPLLWEALDAPQRGLKYLRVTGSNGKTVCAELLLSAFQKSEYVIGSISLPMYEDGRTNIRINAQQLSPEEFASYVERVVQALKDVNLARTKETSEDANEAPKAPLSLSQSELLLSAALLAFREHRCAFCIIESDASSSDPTRSMPAPFAAAICGTIPSENQKEIHDIRSYIVHGIQEIVSAPQDQNAYRVISETCASINCRLTIPTKSELSISRLSLGGSEFSYKDENYKLGLCGKFQVTNATVVLEVINMLSRHGYTLSQEQIFDGLRQTKIPAKFEIVSVSPTVIVDSTHSETAIEVVCKALSDFQSFLGNKLRLCFPDEALADQYRTALSPYDFSIESITTYSPDDKPKDVVSSVWTDLTKDEILFFSVPNHQIKKLRDEILKRLHK
ncbi:MAG: hypothetical protein J6Q82_08330 [Clostridia bacterium]|nr:hypothetical protein [Clostridia bacterium]